MTTATAGKRSSLGIGWLNAVFGVWLIISPFALGFTNNPGGMVNNIATGLLLLFLTFAGMRFGLLRAMIVLVGAWLYASAFILAVPNHHFLWANLILAPLVLVSAVSSEAWSAD